MIWTDKNVKLVEKFIDIRNRGLYCSGEQLTKVYNEVFEKNVHVTNCSSCMRQRISELEKALNKFKKQMELENKAQEALKQEEVDNTPQDVKEAVTEQIKEEISNVTEGESPATAKKGKKAKPKTT